MKLIKDLQKGTYLLLMIVALVVISCSKNDNNSIDTESPILATITKIETTAFDTTTITWDLTTDGQTDAKELTYQLLWQMRGSSEVKNSGTPKALFSTYKLTGLTEKTTYRVWVKVWDKAGNTTEYPAQEFTTPAKPINPTGLDTTNYIQLTTEKKVGEIISFFIDGDKIDKKGFWIDFNNNGKWDEGIDVLPKFEGYLDYTLKSQTFRIYGKVIELICAYRELTDLNISHNPFLRKLFVENNKLPSIKNLEHITKLSLDSHTMLNSTLPTNLSFLDITETTAIPSFDVKAFTNLKELLIKRCKSIHSLDLSKNPQLVRLEIDNTNITTLDLSKQPNLAVLDASGAPLTSVNIQENTKLHWVLLELTKDGKGLMGTALLDFIKALPTKKVGAVANIKLSPAQQTDVVKSLLQSKHWKIY